ncbi:cytochrome c biogenesis heme-transporting ATPase CcmA [Rhodanobacter aciditrophus]|uniref:Cytochrome c biogenesis heme-transporting ATPase CcmA n=1 Tax=Rhodanobacter aciditrophus TaxID=1623218 RepID=A0ABW4B3W6_9GAMM
MYKPINLQIKHLCIERGERLLCQKLSFTVEGGELIRIAGENGSGKSSLMKALLGWLPIEEGTIEFNGEDISVHRDSLLAEQLYIGHATGIKDIFTVQENLSLYCPNSHESDRLEALRNLNLADFEDTPAGDLSAGQKRRVALTRLWLTDKQIWFLDEPFTALDAQGTLTLEHRIKEHLASGGAVIMTTHQPLQTLLPKIIELKT